MEFNNEISIDSLSADELNEVGVQYIDQAPDKAYLYFAEGAKKGSAKAMHNLATCYWMAKGVKFDIAHAFYWNKKAAENGNTNAMRTLATFYTAGAGVVKSEKAAKYWLAKAAGSGDKKAAEMLQNYDVLKTPLSARIQRELAARSTKR